MLYYQLLNLKDKYQTMDKKILNNLNDILSKSKIFFYKKNNKKVNLKNKKNNFNIILNKISDSNYSMILTNEIQNKNINTTNFIKLINLLIEKVTAEGKFIDCYSNFLIDLDRIISKNTNSKIYTLIYERFTKVMDSTDEYSKENFYKFIKILIDKGYFYKTLINKIMEDFSSKKKIYDSYIWLNLNPNLKKKYAKYINEVIVNLKEKNNIRLITLFENLNIKKESKKKKVTIKNNNLDEKKIIKCQNIIKEYLIIEDIQEIKFFIEEEKDIIKFLENAIIQELFINEDEDFEKLISLLQNKFINLKNVKSKIAKLNNDDIFIDFNERKSKILSI